MGFEFQGDWEFEYKFEAFAGLQSRRGPYGGKDSEEESDGSVYVTITDRLDDEPDPDPEQIAALNYLIEHPQKVRNLMFDVIDEQYAELKEVYGYDEEDEDDRAYFPPIEKRDDIRNVFGAGSVFVLLEHKDGIAYLGIECGCTWDEEHGLGFLLHKDRLVAFGAAEQAFDEWEARKDNGTYEAERKKWDDINFRRVELPKPQIYSPHPKYGKLKPSQISANRMYENHLIERGYNEEFIAAVESGEIDINVNQGLQMTFLERALQFNNEGIARFIISRKPKTLKNAIHMAARHCNRSMVELLMENGVDINEPDRWNRNIRALTEQTILQYHRAGKEGIEKYRDFLEWLEGKGARR